MKLKNLALVAIGTLIVSTVHAAEPAKGVKTSAQIESEFRLPQVITPADVDKLSHLNDEEKEFGKMMLKKIPSSHGWFVIGNDPELQALYHLQEREITALLEGDFQAIPFGPMHLSALEASRIGDSDYVHGLFALLTARQIDAFGLHPDSIAKISLTKNPGAALWSDEERMVLQFTQAVMAGGKMSDELYEEIKGAWGEKRMLRMFTWVNFVNTWSRLSNMNNMGFSLDMVPESLKMPPAAIEKGVVPLMAGTRLQFREFIINKLSEFPGPQPH